MIEILARTSRMQENSRENSKIKQSYETKNRWNATRHRVENKVVIQNSQNIFNLLSGKEFIRNITSEALNLNGNAVVRIYDIRPDEIGLPFLSNILDRAKTAYSNGMSPPEKNNFRVYIDKWPRNPIINSYPLVIRRRLLFILQQMNKLGISTSEKSKWIDPRIRDHRKIIVFLAQMKAWLGTCNITKHDHNWKQLILETNHPDFVKALERHALLYGEGLITPVVYEDASGIEDYLITDGYLKEERFILPLARGMVKSAQKKIEIASPYMGEKMLKELRRAAKRGVEAHVYIPLPRFNNSRHYSKMHKKWIKKLEKSGVHVHKTDMFHAKVLLADDIALFGSHNFDSKRLYAGGNLETNMLTKHQIIVLAIKEFFKFFEQTMEQKVNVA